MALRIRTVEDLDNAPELENGAHNLAGADIEIAEDLEDEDLRGADFRGAYIYNVYAKRINLVGAIMEETTIDYVSFINCNLTSVNLRNATIIDSNFSGSDLTRADFRGAILNNLDLSNANLENADFTGACIMNVDFTNARFIERAIGIRIPPRSRRFAAPPGPAPPGPAPPAPPMVWNEDGDCVGEEDPVMMEPIPAGRGFRLEAENRCYDALTLAEMRRRNRPLVGPMTRIPFSENDIARVDAYRRENPDMIIPDAPRANGGKKRKKKETRMIRKKKNTRMTRKNKKIR